MLNVFFSSHLQYTIHFYNIQKGHFNAIVTDEKIPQVLSIPHFHVLRI